MLFDFIIGQMESNFNIFDYKQGLSGRLIETQWPLGQYRGPKGHLG